MGRPTVMTEPRKTTILEALRVGASRTTAAALAGIHETTLYEHFKKGADAAEGSVSRRFHDDVLAAEAYPRHRALGIIMREMENRPDLAWKFIERKEPGYAPPQVHAVPAQSGPVVIQLALASGTKEQRALEAVPDIVEGEVVEQDSSAEASS